ncbi:MAG: GtrA family protein [Patescibacteria group bacterium]
MRKTDIILSLLIGEIAAIYFVSAFSEIVPPNYLEFYRWGLPISFPILSLIGIWISFLIGKKILVIFQIAKYLLSGVLATIIDLSILNFLILIFGVATGIYFTVFKTISFILATSVKFLISKFWTFEELQKGKSIKETIQFFLVTLVGLVINVTVASFLVNNVGSRGGVSDRLWANISGILAAFVTFTWNFLGYKFIVFKK